MKHLPIRQAVLSALLCCLPSLSQAADEPTINESGTVTWSFDGGTSTSTTASVSVDNAVSATSYEIGSNITITGTRSFNGETTNLLQPTTTIAKAEDNTSYVKFTVVPKKGVKFIPTALSFNAAKVGTNGGNFNIYATQGDTKVTLTSAYNPAEKNALESKSYTISGLSASENSVEIAFYIYNLANNKQVALSDITLTGTFTGTPEVVPTYTMALTTADTDAGTVTCSPAGTSFDENTELTVTATENFGYHFKAWVDADGNIVSTENPYTFSITQNTSLTATYTKNNVYALNLDIVGGANTNLVQFSPEGNLVNGTHYYEEGTDVRLTALNNRILTFTQWEDNTTNAQRDVTVNSEMNLTANFSACDYIVGWDLYNDTPNSERSGDYKADTENSGLLSLRNADGATTSWLAGGVAKGKQNGKYCARVWKKLTDKYYFEISFSSKGYSNLVLSAAVGDDYNAYSVMKAEYSLDGTTFTQFGTFNLPNRGWDSEEISLPAEANNQENVYVRFMPDYTSDLTGVTSDNDGTSVAEIFILADSDTSSDEVAPQLLSSVPANGSNGASATGSVILTFDERIVLGEGDATLNGETLTPTISGKTAVYPYTGLDYATDYTFTLPAGAITDRNGNKFEGVTLSFTTIERQQPEARVYDAVVDCNGTGDYTTVQAAIDAAPTNQIKPWLIFVKNGKYNEHVDIPATKPFIHIIGQSRDNTIILDDKLCGGDNALHVSVGATVVVNSNDCYFDNITLENSYGHEKQAGPQALALNTIGDRTVFKNVAMLSYQDTWITPSTSNYRAYVKNSFIEGAVDFIYNSGNIYIDSTTLYINRKSGGYIVAPSHKEDVEWGYVFMNCKITAPGVPSETDIWLGRPWHNYPKTVFINTTAEVTIPAAGWYETMGGLPVLWADYNTMDADGNPLDLSKRRDTYYYTDDSGNKVYGTAKNYLTADEAAQYTVKNVLSGDDNWQPTLITESCNAPKPVIDGTKMRWEAVPYAICYIITKDDQVVAFTTDCEYDYDSSSAYTVQAVNEQGSPTAAAAPSKSTGIKQIVADGLSVSDDVVYNLNGQRVYNPQQGLYICNGKKIVIR